MKTAFNKYRKYLVVGVLIFGLTSYCSMAQVIFTGGAAKVRSTIKGANDGKIIKDNADIEGRRNLTGTIRIQGMKTGDFITCSYLVGRSDNILEGSILFPKDSKHALVSLQSAIDGFSGYGEKIDVNEWKMDVEGNKYACAYLFDNVDECKCYVLAWKIENKL